MKRGRPPSLIAHHLSWPDQVRVRFRKQPKRKRRLAYARSGLIVNFGTTKDSEYWSFPLPPISPHVSAMKSSASSVDVRAFKSRVKVATYMLRKLWLSSACTTCMCTSKISGWLLGIPVSALQSRIKGMSGGFCKHFISIILTLC